LVLFTFLLILPVRPLPPDDRSRAWTTVITIVVEQPPRHPNLQRGDEL